MMLMTYKLEKPYIVDAILIIGGMDSFITNYRLFVGMNPDWRKNQKCRLPYDVRQSWQETDWRTPEEKWPNGVEAWCNMYGQYVTFVMEGDPDDLTPELELCEFGVIANTDSAFTQSAHYRTSRLPEKVTVQRGGTLIVDVTEVFMQGITSPIPVYLKQKEDEEINFVTIDNNSQQLEIQPYLSLKL